MTTSQPPPSVTAPRSRGRALSRPRILVIDDEPVIGSVLGRIFRGSHEVTAVEQGKDALSLLDTGADFDVIFCDVVMPGLSGPEVFEAVRERHPRLVDRFVFITGGLLQEKNRAFLASASRPVVSKPFDIAPLRDLVRRIASPPS